VLGGCQRIDRRVVIATAHRDGAERQGGSAAGATTTTAVMSADCASMRAFMSAICSRTSASVSGVGTSEICLELGSRELGG
jgi:hypothetical protein